MNIHRIGALAAVLLAAGAAAFAEEPQVRQELDVTEQQRFFKGDNTNGWKFEEYSPKPNGLIIDRYKLDLDYTDYEFKFGAYRPDQLDQSFHATGGAPGKFTYQFDLQDMPHLYAYHARSLFVNEGHGYMALPEPIQNYFTKGKFPNTSLYKSSEGITALEGAAPDVGPIRMQTEKGSVMFKYRPTETLTLNVGGSNTSKTGAMPYGTSLGFSNAIELAIPIDQKIYEMGGGAEYAGKTVQAGLRYDVSQFINSNDVLKWDNPQSIFNSTSAAKSGQMALNPSNQSHTITGTAGVSLPLRSRLQGEFQYTVMKQDAVMLPYTINTALVPMSVKGTTIPFVLSDPRNLPSDHVDADLRIANHNYKFTTRPISPLRLTAGWSRYQVVNKGTEYAFAGLSPYDQSWTNGSVSNDLYSYKKDRLEGKADYDVTRWMAVGGGYGVETVDRKREVEQTKEHQTTASLVLKPVQDLYVNGSWFWGYRKMDDFQVNDYKDATGAFTEMPGLRRFDVADRNRIQQRYQVQYTVDEVAIGFNALNIHDDYGSSQGDLTGGIAANENQMYGLLLERFHSYGGDVSFPLSPKASMNVYYEYDYDRRDIRSNANATASASQDAPNDWLARTKQRSHIGGASVTIDVTKKLKAGVGVDIVRSRLDNDPIQQGSALSYVALNEADRTTKTVSARAAYAITDNLHLTGRYAYERFENTDYALGNVPLVDSTYSAIYLGNSVGNYAVHVIGIGLDYSF